MRTVRVSLVIKNLVLIEDWMRQFFKILNLKR